MSDITMDFRQPGPGLADHFSFFYHFQQSADRFEAVDRADYAQLRFILRGHNGQYRFVDETEQAMPEIYVLGPTTGPSRFSGEGVIDVIGVGLMPAGWAALVPMDASAAANRLFDAQLLFGDIVVNAQCALRETGDFDLRVKIFEAMLVALMARKRADYHGFVRTVNEWLADTTTPDVNDLIARTGLSSSQVQRGCKRYFGSPPKVLARKYRALRAAIAMTHHDADLDDMVLDGFYDQSHFIRELKEFTGMTPGAYAEQPTELNREIAKRIALERQNPIKRSGVIT
ncbi:helix-turn-helix domain-containing protein [Sphingomonas sp. AR_OL41]|uniref:helix-turn-helix domain-containing protein n=1 Tax=Sphingomonas sp. AR_OL41 TaxID=3042729 RepID=UPI0024802434|nr:helix-turn-helix domain-containing protein [Sphingomonas sp. AR_OL41]MDH7975260.1 helix-turn-helix domain-containing protein [Sphingomonas sp. AR_OL41]